MGIIFHKSNEELRKLSKNQINPKALKHSSSAPPPLENINETCYMNAIIQALGSCKKMKEDLEKLRSECHSHQLTLFIDLLKALNASKAQEEFNNFMSLYGWCRKGQQDSYEVMSFIINSIYKEVKEIKNREINGEDQSVLPGVITMKSKTSCCCQSKNQHIYRDLALHLPLVNGRDDHYNVQEMIGTMFKLDEIDDKCDKCNTTQTLSLSIEGKPPRTICLHIQANRYDAESGTIIKPKYMLDFPYNLTFAGMSFELVSFLDHSGDVSVGHYMAYRKYCGEWYLVNDNIVRHLQKVERPNKYCLNPYVLFYESIWDN